MSNSIRQPNNKQRPRVLIGASCESLPVADALRHSLLAADVLPWRHGFYPLTGSALVGLVEALSSVDFAVFLLSGEDADRMRQEENTVARDNVLLQLGVALTVLGQNRTFLVYPKNFRRDYPAFHVAVDGLGMTPAFYEQKGTDPEHREYPSYALGTAVSQISRVLSRLGRRQAGAPVVSDSPPPRAASGPLETAARAEPPVTVEDRIIAEPAYPFDPTNSDPASVPVRLPAATTALSSGPVRIRFNTNRRVQDLRPDAQITTLKGWWDDLSEKQRRSIIRYAEVDRLLNFRSGTTRHYLRDIAEDSGYIADHEGESLVIYQPAHPLSDASEAEANEV